MLEFTEFPYLAQFQDQFMPMLHSDQIKTTQLPVADAENHATLNPRTGFIWACPTIDCRIMIGPDADSTIAAEGASRTLKLRAGREYPILCGSGKAARRISVVKSNS